jgi:hypothetical protein
MALVLPAINGSWQPESVANSSQVRRASFMCSSGPPQSAASPQLIAMVAPRCPKLSELKCGFVGSRRSLI